MTKTAIHFIILSIVLLLAQAVVFDNVCLFNVAVPVVFVYTIFKLPVSLGTNSVLVISFLSGFIIDIFADTYGMNSLACTIAGMTRNGVIHMFVPRGEEMSDPIPSAKSMGRATYIRYMTVMTLLYCILIFGIQAFTFFNILLTIERVIASTILSLLLMIAIDCLTTHRREKRL